MITRVIVPKRVKCPRCGETWEYNEQDIQLREEKYTVYHNIEEVDRYRCIVCPDCKYPIKL